MDWLDLFKILLITGISNDVLEKEKQMKMLYDNPDVGIWTFDVKTGKYLNMSNGMNYITGYTKDDFNNGLQWYSLVYSDDLHDNIRKTNLN